MRGAQTHYATGMTLRRALDNIQPGWLSQEYDPDEVYVQTTCHARTIDSAISQLEGLYGMDLMFPEWDHSFELNSMVCNEDFLLRMSRDMCPRFDDVRHAVLAEIGTQLMYDEIDYDMERSGLYERLRELADMKGESTHRMHQVCDYIYWARESGLTLKFELTDEEYKRCLVTKEKGAYAEFFAHEELSALPIYQLMRQLDEFSEIVTGQLEWTDAEIFT